MALDEAAALRLRDTLREQRSSLLGTMPDPAPLDPLEGQVVEYASHKEIHLTYGGEPGERIPAWLLVPRDYESAWHERPWRSEEGRYPAALALHQCGHCDIAKDQVIGRFPDLGDQAYGLELVRQGFVVLAPDSNLAGERFDPTLRQRWQSLDYFMEERTTNVLAANRAKRACCAGPGGVMGWTRGHGRRWKAVFDAMRAVDVLVTHPLVDCSRIVAIGHSMGGHTVMELMERDERVSAAVVSGDCAALLDWLPHGIPLAEMLIAIAPRRLLQSVGRRDAVLERVTPGARDEEERLAPIRAAHAAAQDAYQAHAAPSDALVLFEFDGPHGFPVEAREAAYEWLRMWVRRSGT